MSWLDLGRKIDSNSNNFQTKLFSNSAKRFIPLIRTYSPSMCALKVCITCWHDIINNYTYVYELTPERLCKKCTPTWNDKFTVKCFPWNFKFFNINNILWCRNRFIFIAYVNHIDFNTVSNQYSLESWSSDLYLKIHETFWLYNIISKSKLVI